VDEKNGFFTNQTDNNCQVPIGQYPPPQLENIPWWGKYFKGGANVRLGGKI